ncbi:tripartite tricarboxylate transporter substrate binding protein [Limnohabitans sp. Rim28]|jgi:tripartite-type tricarboxylate transporter receptor subunit TctC|uniref:Bug family tripartite tricarboxylate transporter substrate binding protein n=1 Tax=Limnohabitans sp. Rim28 TaxID=1100720 RepID=UPI00030B0180|nr:tripartite tricarboxylate transporter substrate binding protein [Limnohabitans sp. Rim28]PVE08068.1 ABC transporter substrate-binding protein [Limnohabitans sp. Rim28]
MQLNRRQVMGLAAAGALTPLHPALAQAGYPSKPITLVVPFAPGGAVDNSGRLMAERLSRVLKVPVIVDNKAGAGGAIGSSFAAKAAPDGYTLVVTSQSTHVVNPAVNPKLPYDALKDFAPITLIDRLANVLLVNKDLPVKTFADLLKYAQANPDKLSYASAGIGSVSHLSMELMKVQAKLPMAHIAYRGAGPALVDLLSGQVQLTWNNLSSNMSNIRNGNLRALAVAAPQRVPQLPDVPTFGELKLPDLNLTSWTGLAAPANTPEPIVQLLYRTVRGILNEPATQSVWTDKGMMVPEDISPAAYRTEIGDRIQFYQRIAKANNIVAE